MTPLLLLRDLSSLPYSRVKNFLVVPAVTRQALGNDGIPDVHDVAVALL